MTRATLSAVVIEQDPDFPILTERREIEVTGCLAQTLRALLSAGSMGVTAQKMSSWALRLSHYVFVLRHDYGLDIETIKEQHGGDFPGKHGRYVLRSRVILADYECEAA
ncbi:MAG: hypothetical protein O2817_08000 [Proteobacteria bacterium]|nr:hypothetical protein [Pseudomonadota bacterium]